MAIFNTGFGAKPKVQYFKRSPPNLFDLALNEKDKTK